MGFSRQEYWSGLPSPPPGDLPNPGIEPASLALAGVFFTTRATCEALREFAKIQSWVPNNSIGLDSGGGVLGAAYSL